MRDYRGRYSQKRMTAIDRIVVLGWMTFTIAVGAPLYYQDHQIVQSARPYFPSYQAQASNLPADSLTVSSEIVSNSPELVETMPTAGEATPQPVQAIAPRTQKQEILMLAVEIFGDKADEAIQIMKCESGYRPDNHGDKHLMSINQQTGEHIGDSIGLFQIRTGSSDWNRALANGMSADEFRAEMKVPEKNMKYAKQMYDKQGWTPWLNCKNKLGL